tara:strand:- start:1825 stop:2646 length:822 start_codon:yes stop_codon:yes gene_type:complete
LQILSELDTSIASVGDQVVWNIRLNNIEKNLSLEFPKLEVKSDDSISIISQSNIIDNNLIIGQSFKLSFWETGNFLTPSYYVKVVNDINKNEFNFEPERRSVKVLSVLEENSKNNMRPLKGPVPVDSIFPMALFIKIILMLFFISLMIFIWTKRKPSAQIISIGKNQISPHKFANNRLLHLDANGFSKEFYFELSHITRQFVEKSCYIRALEMTTEEISENENIFKMNDGIFSEWVSLLKKADLIKFAKKSTPISEMEGDKKVAFNIIKKALN